jgi:hypothetical protein
MIRALALFVCAAAPAALLAQQRPAAQTQHSCVMRVDSARGGTNFQTVGGLQNVYSGGGVWAHCTNQPTTTIYSDSFNFFQSTNAAQFIGSVRFRDSSGTLDADKVTYWSRIERLFAEGNVFTRNLASGTEMRGPNMDFYRVAPGIRDTQELNATGRPVIRFRSAADSAARADTANPFIIIADRVHMRHTDRMWGSGHVFIDRSDLHATSDSASLELGDSLGLLIGSPVVTGYDTTKVRTSALPPTVRIDTVRLTRGRVRVDTTRGVPDTTGTVDSSVAYRLTGQRIRFDLTGRQKLKRVLSSGMANARGTDWHLSSDTLDMAVDSGQIQRAQAWGSERRATAISGLNTITADSLDIQMPAAVMRQVWAYGTARATSKADSTWVEDDWLSGDSLRARFRTLDSTARRRSEIEQVIAFGTARAYYHTENQRDSAGQRGINYSRGDKINIALSEGKVRVVDIVGHVDGVYLEPKPPGWDTLPDSSVVDSLGQRDRGTVGRDTGSGPVRSPRPTVPPSPGPVPSPRPTVPLSPALPGRRP